MSTDPATRLSPPQKSSRSTLRWVSIGVASLIVHLLALDALPRITVQVAEPGDVGEPLRARLVSAVSATTPVAIPAAEPAPAARPSPRAPRAATRAAVPRPRPTRPVVGTEVFVPESTETPAEVVLDGTVGRTTPVPLPPPLPAPTPPEPVAGPTTPTAPPAATIEPPRSARLDYKVLSQNVRDSNPIYGVGTIDWASTDGRYTIDLHADVKVAFVSIGILSSRSEGTIGGMGLSPERYVESPRRRAAVAVNFNRDARQSITFSASAAVVPLAAGTQDRLSILFQVGGLLLGDASQGAAGARFEVAVAGVRGDVDTWSFESLGKEAVDGAPGGSSTTHLRRVPRAGSNDRLIDLWVADDGGYPARVVYTERDGSTVTMTLEKAGTLP